VLCVRIEEVVLLVPIEVAAEMAVVVVTVITMMSKTIIDMLLVPETPKVPAPELLDTRLSRLYELASREHLWVFSESD
jgi:hypothetical protein